MPESSRRQGDQRSSIWVGCSGWAYPSWRPAFYPAGTPQKKLLEAYAARLNSVEVNYTFRTLPTEAVVEGWLRATPDTFRFSFKAPQRITHFARLRDTGRLLPEFVQSLKPVIDAARLGIILFQLPPNFAADPGLLGDFLVQAGDTFGEFAKAGPGLRLCFEFRHASWFTDTTYAVLEQHGAALCVAESDELQTPDVRTAPFACYRLRRSKYSKAALKAVQENLNLRAASGEVFAYFKHEDEPSGPLRAAAVLKGLRR